MEPFIEKEQVAEPADQVQQEAGSGTMPAPLYNKVLSMFLFGAGIILVCIVFAVAFRHNMRPAVFLSGGILGLFLLCRGLLIRQKWKAGIIEEHIYRCISCKRVIPISVMADTRATDRKNNSFYDLVCTEPDDMDGQSLYEFRIGKGGEYAVPGSLVILYVDQRAPRAPVAWKVL